MICTFYFKSMLQLQLCPSSSDPVCLPFSIVICSSLSDQYAKNADQRPMRLPRIHFIIPWKSGRKKAGLICKKEKEKKNWGGEFKSKMMLRSIHIPFYHLRLYPPLPSLAPKWPWEACCGLQANRTSVFLFLMRPCCRRIDMGALSSVTSMTDPTSFLHNAADVG